MTQGFLCALLALSQAAVLSGGLLVFAAMLGILSHILLSFKLDKSPEQEA